ncbi:hypothetical protein BGX34_003601 [Mortierella sp. NVP85]|nr:hypothetical protein BGX34_003601 [Mortierella sp. NVP85]
MIFIINVLGAYEVMTTAQSVKLASFSVTYGSTIYDADTGDEEFDKDFVDIQDSFRNDCPIRTLPNGKVNFVNMNAVKFGAHAADLNLKKP